METCWINSLFSLYCRIPFVVGTERDLRGLRWKAAAFDEVTRVIRDVTKQVRGFTAKHRVRAGRHNLLPHSSLLAPRSFRRKTSAHGETRHSPGKSDSTSLGIFDPDIDIVDAIASHTVDVEQSHHLLATPVKDVSVPRRPGTHETVMG